MAAIVVESGFVHVIRSFYLKDRLRSLGFYFNGGMKSWCMPVHMVPHVFGKQAGELRVSDLDGTASQGTQGSLGSRGSGQKAAGQRAVRVEAAEGAVLVHESFAIKGELKDAGFRFSGEHSAWYVPEMEFRGELGGLRGPISLQHLIAFVKGRTDVELKLGGNPAQGSGELPGGSAADATSATPAAASTTLARAGDVNAAAILAPPGSAQIFTAPTAVTLDEDDNVVPLTSSWGNMAHLRISRSLPNPDVAPARDWSTPVITERNRQIQAAQRNLSDAETALLFACGAGDETLFLEAIRSPPRMIGPRNGSGMTPLHACVASGSIRLAYRVCLMEPLAVLEVDEVGNNPIAMAAELGREGVYQTMVDALFKEHPSTLLKALQTANDEGMRPIDLACDRSSVGSVTARSRIALCLTTLENKLTGTETKNSGKRQVQAIIEMEKEDPTAPGRKKPKRRGK